MATTIQVGDHDPELIRRPGTAISHRRMAELAFTRKLEATAIELRDAVKKLSEARILFSLAQHNEHYEATIHAGRLIISFADQVSYLAGGIKIAIENEQQQRETRK